MKPSRRLPTASACALVLALIVGACGSSATATPTATPQPTGAGGLGGLGGLFGSGGLGGSGGLLGGLSFHGNPDLEAKLPSTLCGGTAFKMSMPAGAIPAAALGALGGGISSLLSGVTGTATVSWAFAIADPTTGATCDTTIYAFQVSGGDPTTLMNEIVQSQVSDGATSSQASVGGKNVTVLVTTDGTRTYSYVNGDTVYGVEAADDASAAAALSQLP
ncbi:MAG: hypothetical protein ACHQZR_09030 [Candidatus Limnocylindrales bacterium]